MTERAEFVRSVVGYLHYESTYSANLNRRSPRQKEVYCGMEPATIAKDMSTATARVAYDGEALEQGYMDVRDLAPALLEIGAICERANEILNGDRSKVSVNVRADFKTGSFEIVLEVLQSAAEHIKGLLFGQPIQDAKYLLEVIGLSGTTGATIYALYRRLKGKRAEETARLENGNIAVTVNNITIEVKPETLFVYNDEAVRAKVEGSLRPLLKEGIDTFEVRAGNQVTEKVTKEEAKEAYEARRGIEESKEPPVTDSTYETALEIVKIPFKDKLVWNFSMGAQRITAEMKDPVFLERHRAGQTFYRTGDVLIVRLRTRAWTTPEGLKVQHDILEVISHMHPAAQLEFPASEGTVPPEQRERKGGRAS